MWESLTSTIDAWRNGAPAELVFFGLILGIGALAGLALHLEARIAAIKARIRAGRTLE